MQLFTSEATSKGFTCHEMVNDFDVIHMGGRTYNRVAGRFMQAGLNIQFAGNLQSYHRYSYVMNNPMKYADPSGYFLAGIIKNAFRSVLKLIPQSVGYFFIALGSKLCGPWAGACAAFATYEFSRVHGMSRTGALRAAAAAGVAAYAFGKIGDYYNNAGAANLMDAIDDGSDFSHLTSFGGNYLIAGQIAAQIAARCSRWNSIKYWRRENLGMGSLVAVLLKGLGTPISDRFDQGVISGTVTQMVMGGTASVIWAVNLQMGR
ncbi:MAG: RHS repeat-associated core domain-containing protein [Rheinheimera sp.]|nr:RHS repeat-associated core domain-containing protein [Rheinheimera sp.]